MRIQSLQLSIKNKLIILFMLFLCLPFIVFGYLWYQNSTKTIETNAIEHSQLLMAQIDHGLNLYFSDLKRATLPLLTHPVVQDFLNIRADENFEIFRSNQQFTEELFPNFIYGRADIARISVLSQHGNMISSNTAFLSKEEFDWSQVFLQDTEQTPLANHYEIMGINQDGNGPPILTITRKIVDKHSYLQKGIMVIDLKLSVILDILSQAKLGESGFVWLVNESGQIIYHPNQDLIGNYTDEIEQTLNGYYIHSTVDRSDNMLSIYKPMNSLGWMMISEFPISELNRNLIQLRNMTLLFSFSIIIISMIAAGGFSFSLTKSLSRLQRLMKRAEIGDLSVTAPQGRKDEIGNLYRSFNKMVNEIRTLVTEVHSSQLREKELEIKNRESELLAMQAQINPHFLYNTLEVINSHAIIEGNMTISRAATGLADLFRYSVGSLPKIVGLFEEFQNSRIYLDIQKERYRYLEVVFDIEEKDIQHVRSVKLMLQPLLENAFIHGYEGLGKRPDYIKLTGNVENNAFVVRIIDNGGGMEKSHIEHYNQLFAQPSVEGIREGFNHASTRIGLWNVHYRLRHTFGYPFGLHIEKSDENGTVIMIKLPIEESPYSMN